MKAITPEQFLAVAGVRKTTYMGFRSRGETALAFGTEQSLAGGTFLDLDAVAWLILDELTPALARRNAAEFLRGFSDVWMRAVGRAERSEEPVWLVVAESGEKLGKLRGSQRNSYDSISGDFGTLPEFGGYDHTKVRVVPCRMTLVNITQVLTAARWNASRIGLRLSSPMVPDADDPAFQVACSELKNARRAMATEPRRGVQ